MIIRNRLYGMKRFLYIILLTAISLSAFAQTDLDAYMQTYRDKGQGNAALERELIGETNSKKLINILDAYYTDTLLRVRRKAYYLTYKKAMLEPEKNQAHVVYKLVIGCKDNSSAIINQNLGYLKLFSTEAFNKKSIELIKDMLVKSKYQQFGEVFLIAGYLNVGFETMFKLYIKPETTQKLKWTIGLALARMGDEKALENCMNAANNMEVGDQVVAYLVPDLIYTHQREAIEYCVNIIKNEKKLCSSPNAESSVKIVCGYRVIELLAPVIKDFPYELDASGTLKTSDYVQALDKTRIWLENNSDYELNLNRY